MNRPPYPDELMMLSESNKLGGEHSEVSHAAAFEAWDYLMVAPTLTEEVVRETHSLLMAPRGLNNSTPRKWQGFYRQIPGYVGTAAMLNWHDIPATMEEWLVGMNGVMPEEVAQIIDRQPDQWRAAMDEWGRRLHIAYEKIHPFVDGNGRTGRMFYNWHRLKHALPVNVIYADDRFDYFGWFEEQEASDGV